MEIQALPEYQKGLQYNLDTSHERQRRQGLEGVPADR